MLVLEPQQQQGRQQLELGETTLYCRYVTIMPGAGVNAENISEIATQTGAIWLHGSFRGEDGKTSAAHVNRAARALGP